MEPLDAKIMLKNSYDDPSFFVDFYNVGRANVGDIKEREPYIKRTKSIRCWRIDDNSLQEVTEKAGSLFDAETYFIQWSFDLIVQDKTCEESLFYYWKGDNARKGFSPLPTEIEKQNPIVDRICQWSEPALFFHMFPRSLIVFNCHQKDFNVKATRLFMVRGELENEIHLYEIPCFKNNLRSRAVFVLIAPTTSTIFYWYGMSVPVEYQQLVKKVLNIHGYENDWTNFEIVEVKEGKDNNFLKLLNEDCDNYVSIPNSMNFSPRLFYFNSITGDFLATEVEYPLRHKKAIAPFPFLQSHLYTAIQPALFLLDNDKEIWLWQGLITEETNLEQFNTELQLAKRTTTQYALEKEKARGFSVPIKHVLAVSEPADFINIFPYWKKY